MRQADRVGFLQQNRHVVAAVPNSQHRMIRVAGVRMAKSLACALARARNRKREIRGPAAASLSSLGLIALIAII